MLSWERRTLVLVNLAGIMEKADEALLPAVYREIGAALHLTPAGLGSLSLFRSIVQSSCYPLATYMALRYNRTHVIALGALLWAAATFLVALSSTYLQVAISRALNGVGLALVIPSIQSLVADSSEDSNRGSAFGWLHLTGSIGSVLGGLSSLALAPHSFMGIDGWRLAFHLIAIVSIIVGILVRFFAVDPNYTNTTADRSKKHIEASRSLWTEAKQLAEEAKSVIRIHSFQIIVTQGVTGSFPWSALTFTPMWFELVGFSHKMTGFLMGMFMLAVMFGGLLGGKMGDFLARRFPDSGRIIFSQISSGSAVPLAGMLLLALPNDPSSGFAHMPFFFFMGLCMSWNGPATNNPIFAEIVPDRSRTSIYALGRTFESALSSFAPPIVGILADVYGFKPITNGSSEETAIETDRENAAPLAKALFTAIAVSMSLSCFIYSFLYSSYPKDRERKQIDSLMEPELQKAEHDDTFEDEDTSLLQVARSESYQKEMTMIDMDYREEEFGIDENDRHN